MPTDLLAALKGNSNNNGYNDYDNDNDNFMDSNYLTGFFSQVEQLRSEVDKIKSLVEEIKTKHNELLSAPNPDESMFIVLPFQCGYSCFTFFNLLQFLFI